MSQPRSSLPPGRIDVHSHLLPGVDDGCRDLDESIACVRRLMAAGYVGSVCTPHIWHELFPTNTPEHIGALTRNLQEDLLAAGLDYRVWPGGEVRLFKGLADWVKRHGMPTLAGSRCVLVDFWDDAWPKWVDGVFEWMLGEGYQPILAHPERLRCGSGLDACLRRVEAMGVWLQGNFRCLTGEEGPTADRVVRDLLREGRYRLMALDMHRPDSLQSRLEGLQLMESEFGPAEADRLASSAPRALVVGD